MSVNEPRTSFNKNQQVKTSGGAQQRAPPAVWQGGLKRPGDDLLSPAKDYHRPRGLNGRVRDGNGCGPPGMVTGKRSCINEAAVRVARSLSEGTGPEGGVNAAKRSAISTG